MDRELCFCIENKNIYLEQVLVDYMDIPIFFLCRDDSQFYVALCTDVEELKYIIVRAAETDLYNLLHGKIPMREIILNQKAYWEVMSGDDVLLDQIINHNINDLDMTLLPEENACFKILTEEMRGYVQQFDNAFFDADKFGKTIDPVFADVKMESIMFRNTDDFIEKYINVGEFSFKLQVMSRILRYAIDLSGEYISHDKRSVKLRKSVKVENWKSNDVSYDAA